MRIKELNDIYKQLPRIKCKGLCTESCGPIVYGDAEGRNIIEHHGEQALPQPRKDLTCNQLTPSGRCRIYNQRPLICRLFGVVKGLQCRHGCVPDRILSDRKAHKLLDRVVHDLKTNLHKYVDTDKGRRR